MSGVKRLLIHLAFYPSIAFNRVMCWLGVWNQWNWVDAHILLGAVPSRGQLKTLQAMGIRNIVNLCEEFPGHTRELENLGLKQYCIPVLDYTCPSEDDLIRGICILQQQAAANRRTFVHCKAGQGRSPTLVMCYLMAARRMNASQAYAYLKSLRGGLTRRLDHRPTVLSIERKLGDGSLLLDANGACA